MYKLPDKTSGLRLGRIKPGGKMVLCDEVHFVNKAAAADTVLRRAALSGRVEIGAEFERYFADVIDADGDILETVALDGKSYSALKNHWMRCRVAP